MSGINPGPDSELFEPRSPNAVFATILARLDSIDSKLAEQSIDRKDHDRRLTALERDKWYQRGLVAAIGAGATIAWNWITHAAGKQ